jgi:flotillin
MESRQAVAENKKKAEIAEIESKREVDLQAQEATRQVGIKRAETERLVALADEQKKQEVNETSKITVEKEMQVLKIKEIKQAEILKEVEIVNSNKLKEKLILEAEAKLEESKKSAEGVALMGQATAEAEKAKLLAPVEAQVRLAQEIGSNSNYQEYLVSLERIKAQESVGTKQAEALAAAEIKIIANAGNAGSGIKSVTDILSAQGGTQIGAMIEGLGNIEGGQALLKKLGLMKENENNIM